MSADGTLITGSSRVIDPNGPIQFPDHAVFWKDGVLHDLGIPAGSQRAFCGPVSPDGTTIVGIHETNGGFGDRVFVWTQETGVVLVPPPPGAYHHWARDIAADNQTIVGQVSPAFGDFYAFLSSPALGTVDLNAYLPTLGIDLVGWQLWEATSISADGTIIAGNGLHNGVEEAWIVDLGLDSDEDGLKDDWEINGIPYLDDLGVLNRYVLDADGDGQSDADPMHKDLFVEVDAMEGQSFTQASIDMVVAAFEAAPHSNPDSQGGIRLHVVVDETDVPLNTDWQLYSDSCMPVGFSYFEVLHFGSVGERSDPSADQILDAKRLAFRHGIVAERSSPGSGGCGYLGGDQFIIWTAAARVANSDEDLAMAFMHELGHNLGLDHGGGDAINGKPNYPSIMNYVYAYRMAWSAGFWKLDYSGAGAALLPVINETSIDESTGIGSAGGVYAKWFAPYGYDFDISETEVERRVGYMRLNGKPTDIGGPLVDTFFYRDGSIMSNAQQDMNFLLDQSAGVNLPTSDSFGEVFLPHDDWSSIRLKSRAALAYASAAPVPQNELTVEARDYMDENFPPPPCDGDFNDDGFVNGDDYDAFAEVFDIADPAADVNNDGFVNGDDYDFFAEHFDAGC
ncbi:MAG: hypothetical protein U0638_14020 [Phycisphaerales bacterium]